MKNTTWMHHGFYAHRGLHTSELPENTIAAFENAVQYHFNIELDVQLTKDNQFVVCHDKNLKRLTNKDINIFDATYDEIKELSINNTKHKIPLLRDVLAVFPKDIKLLIELKKSKRNKEFVHMFMEFMRDYEFTYAVLSFDPRIVNLFKKHYPDTIRGFIRKIKHTKCSILNLFISILPAIKVTKPDFIMHRYSDLPNQRMNRFVKKKPVLAYTCKSMEDLKEIKETYTNAVFEGFIPK